MSSNNYYNQQVSRITTKVPFENLSGDFKAYLGNLTYISGREIDIAFLINLDRSVARFEQAKYHLDKANVEFYRFKAVDGYELNIENLDTGEVITGRQLRDTTVKTRPGIEYKMSYHHDDVGEITYSFSGVLSAGEFGVTASHMGIWKASLEYGLQNVLIFEDDVVIKDHDKFNAQVQTILDNTPNNFDVLFLDYYQVAGERYGIPGNEYVSAVSKDAMAWGTHAAIYSRKGMEKLVEQKFNAAVDVQMWLESSYNEDGLIIYTSEVKLADVADQDVLALSSTINMMGRYEATNFDNSTSSCYSIYN